MSPVAVAPMVLAVNATLPVSDLADFIAHARTRPVLLRLRGAVDGALKQPALLERLTALGAEPLSLTPAAFDDYVQKDAAYWGEIVRRLGLPLDN